MKSIIKWLIAITLTLTALFSMSGCGTESSQGNKELSPSAAGILTVRMLDIGQGDAFLLEKDGHFALIDSGDVDQRPKMKEYLKQYHAGTLDTVIITHPHADHLGGMAAVFETVKVKHLYDDGLAAPTPTYRNYVKNIKEKEIPYSAAKRGDKIEILPGVSFYVLGPVHKIEKKKGQSDFNNNSVVGRLVYGSFSMMFTGDAEKEEESSILKAGGDFKSTVLKAGHHGSRTSSSPAFLKAVDPEDAFISCGRGNDYGHPHKSTLQKLEDRHISIFRTDLDGTVTLTTNGNTYQIAKEH